MSSRPGIARRVFAALLQRCPGCLEGRIFRSLIAMEERCARCSYSFVRAPGDYLGAMYFSYPFAFIVLGAIALLTQLVAPDLSWPAIVAIASVGLLPCVPWIFRISRAFWLHFDEYFRDLGRQRPT